MPPGAQAVQAASLLRELAVAEDERLEEADQEQTTCRQAPLAAFQEQALGLQ